MKQAIDSDDNITLQPAEPLNNEAPLAILDGPPEEMQDSPPVPLRRAGSSQPKNQRTKAKQNVKTAETSETRRTTRKAKNFD